MNNFNLDLSGSNIFDKQSLSIDKKVTFIFGKNGTGKSTMTSLLKNQALNYDFRSFQGFDGVVGEDKKLNAVILGEENNETDKEIKNLEKEISTIRKTIESIQNDINQSEDTVKNFYTDLSNQKNKYNNQEKKIDNFCRGAASEIKNLDNPRIAKTNYNITDFKKEIKKANKLDDKSVEKHRLQVNTDVKNAAKLKYKKINLADLLQATNNLLLKKIEEKEMIVEFSGNTEKTRFAEDGIKLHAIDERCAFCGNIINEERYKKLERYFSADDIGEFKKEIENHYKYLDNIVKEINNYQINLDDFYPGYISEASQVKDLFKEKQSRIIEFIDTLKYNTADKLKNLFQETDLLELEIPESIEEYINKFNDVVEKNNISNLEKDKEKSRDKLRYNEIYNRLNNFKYNDEKSELDKLKGELDILEEQHKQKNESIDNKNKEIKDIQRAIAKLQEKTKNEIVLADKINQKLKLYVNFDLEHVPGTKENGYYFIKSRHNEECRDITELSTGEKNIIAFLYFIEKIEEVDNPRANLDKFIVFDDPMNSNDETMQYLIIEELNSLIKKLSDKDKIIIMTHNNHFYINVKYNYSSYKKNTFLRLLSDGEKTSINHLTDSEEDFKTNYGALWTELKFLYENAPSESMLLNPIRRIIETYTKFNSIKKDDMLKHVPGAAKLFNVNSHSIDDLEAELNGRNMEDIMKMMKECFVKENAINHFNQYWKINL